MWNHNQETWIKNNKEAINSRDLETIETQLVWGENLSQLEKIQLFIGLAKVLDLSLTLVRNAIDETVLKVKVYNNLRLFTVNPDRSLRDSLKSLGVPEDLITYVLGKVREEVVR